MRIVNLVMAIIVALALALSLGTPAQSGAGDFAWRQDKFHIDLGGFLTSVNTDATLNSTLYGRGTRLDFEKDLGLKENPLVWRLDAGWRMTNRQELVFSWYQINRSSTKTLASDINWGSYTFLGGSGAGVKWDSTFYQLYYRFAFVQGAKGEFGGDVGISYLRQTADLSGWATIRSQGGTRALYRSVNTTLDAPVPVLGLYGLYQFTPKFLMKGDIQYLKVNVSNVDGAYTDVRLAFDYYPGKHVGFGIGWYYDKYDVSSTKNSWKGDFTYDFNGPVAYVSFRF